MGNTWIIDLRHYLTPAGAIVFPGGPSRRLADYWTRIVVEATHNLDDPPRLRCRRRPGRRPCSGTLNTMIDPDSDAIHWWCPSCGDQGRIDGWQGSLWDGFVEQTLTS